jgi:anthranilate synthase/aminodeoxychorismate synthase-like glutamine amidotransferase
LILVIDNYDSFVHNLARHFRLLGCQTEVIRNDEFSIEKIAAMNPAAIVLSPGPCTPNESGICVELVRQVHQRIPILGICLGHQAIVQAFGGNICRAAEPIHGSASLVWHDESELFSGVANPFQVGRYHSLIADREKLPVELIVRARTKDKTIMVVQHVSSPCVGIQFHPESILTESGLQLLRNFLMFYQIPVVETGDQHAGAQ